MVTSFIFAARIKIIFTKFKFFESECLNPLQLRLVILNAAYSYDSIFTYYVYGFKCSAEYQYVTR